MVQAVMEDMMLSPTGLPMPEVRLPEIGEAFKGLPNSEGLMGVEGRWPTAGALLLEALRARTRPRCPTAGGTILSVAF